MKAHGSTHRSRTCRALPSRSPKRVDAAIDELAAYYARAFSPISAHSRAARDVETVGATDGHAWNEVPLWDRPRVRRALVRFARATSSVSETERLVAEITDLPFSVRLGETSETTVVLLRGTEIH